jgi:hypothetical protein
LKNAIQNKRQWYIYVLIDPRFVDAGRYVGYTSNPKKRLESHLKSCWTENTHKATWIRSLLKANVKPVMKIIETGTGDWTRADQYWIQYYLFHGANLTNWTIGGKGREKLNHGKNKN